MMYLGAVEVVAPDRALVIRVNNVEEVIQKKGGTPGSEDLFYAEMRRQMSDQFRSQGMDASVDVVQTRAATPGATTSSFVWKDFVSGVGVGAAGMLLVWGCSALFSQLRRA